MISPISMDKASSILYTLNNNDMLSASFVDVFGMDTPRTIVEFNNRGKQAGIEMAFREYSSTLISVFSPAAFALVASKIANKFINPDVKANPSLWATDKSLNVFNSIYQSSDKTKRGFVENSLNSMSGLVGHEVKSFADVHPEDKKVIVDDFLELINNGNLTKKQAEALEVKIKDGIITSLGADNNIFLKHGEHELTSNLSHSVRDIKDLAKNVFFNAEGTNPDTIIDKLKKINKTRIGFAIPLAMLLGITNQYINRQWTKKRTGIDNFVGENGYENNVNQKKEAKEEKGLWFKKLASAGIFSAMVIKTMGVKKPSELISKLEFDGPVTSGNAIKAVYGTLIVGRMLAAKDSTELRETNVRDYLGFLNWLVLGGFVSKGVAKLMDKKEDVLFNVSKKGKGVSHFLNDISLKSHKEIIAQGGDIQGNLKKLNKASLAGMGYSFLMLGVLLPKFNIWMTKNYDKFFNKNKAEKDDTNGKTDNLSSKTFVKSSINSDILNSKDVKYAIKPDMKDFIKQVS